MQWTGEGIIIGVRRHGETSVIVEAMVEGRGRHLGLVRGGRSKRLAATLQPGNSVQLNWHARLEDHLGAYTIELIHARAAAMIADRQKLYLGQLICSHLRLLPERDPHDMLLAISLRLLDECEEIADLAVQLARFELTLLDELGFGLDIFSSTLSGETKGLTHVSPRTGRAVTEKEAAPYVERLLPLPQFLTSDVPATGADIINAFRLTGHFIAMHVWSARQIDPPAVRDQLIKILEKQI